MEPIQASGLPLVGRVVQVPATRPGAGELGRISTVPVEIPFGRGKAVYYRIEVETDYQIPGTPAATRELDPTRIDTDPTRPRDPSDPRQVLEDALGQFKPARAGEAGELAPETAAELFRLRLEEATDPVRAEAIAASGSVQSLFDRLLASVRGLLGGRADGETTGFSQQPRGGLVDTRV
jgi:hypothetical protein